MTGSQGFLQATYEGHPHHFHSEIKKIEPKEIPNCLIPCPPDVFTWQQWYL